MLGIPSADWINRVGIILNFAAFWFAAPELLGERRLRAWQHRIQGALRWLPPVFGVFGFALCVAALLPTQLFLGSSLMLGVVEWTDLHTWLSPTITSLAIVAAWLVGIATIPSLAYKLGGALEDISTQRIVLPLVRRLATDTDVRRQSLVLGIVMFVLGNLLQFVATF